jgi:hypothetical protein
MKKGAGEDFNQFSVHSTVFVLRKVSEGGLGREEVNTGQ